MKKFPSKKIAAAYESARGKVFNKHSRDRTYIDENGNKNYDHVSMNWLEDAGILGVELNHDHWVFEYRIVK